MLRTNNMTNTPTNRRPRGEAALSILGPAFAAPILTREEETDLVGRWLKERDPAALTRLVESHGRFVVKVASRYRWLNLPFDDLLQEGLAGLIHGINRFDPAKGFRLSTYARWSIRSYIQDFILRNWSSVHLSRQDQVMFFANRSRRERQAREWLPANGTQPDWPAGQSDATERAPGLGVRARDRSLNARVFEGDGEELQDLLADERPTPEDAVIDSLDRQTWSRRLRAAILHLPDRERSIVQERYLREERTGLRELGERFGVSKERVRQLEKRALQRLGELLQQEEELVER